MTLDPQLVNAYATGRVAPNEHVHVLLAAMPKSGSTYLMTMLAALDGFERRTLFPSHHRREHELALELVIRAHAQDWVSQAHVRHSTVTARFLHVFSISPVLQVRDLHDVVVSLHDHLMNIALVNPIAYVTEDFRTWARERRLAFVVDMFVPWYLNFFLSWLECDDKLVVRYEDLIRDPVGELRRVADYAGLERTGDELHAAVSEAATAPIRTRNTMSSGRGRSLPPELRSRIAALAAYYPGADLTLLGLE